jgi:hypothetical protein
MLAVSLLVVSRGLAAPTPDPDSGSPRVQAAAADGPPEPPPQAKPPPPQIRPIVSTTYTTLPTPGRLTAVSLKDLVTIRAAHPRPMGPDTNCLARTVLKEASNQTLRGQLAVAQVVLNRMKSATYPKSACAVVGQPGQFAYADADLARGRSKPWDTAVAIATIAQDSRVAQVAPGALFFHATYVSPSWSQTHERIAQIGDHVFYR